MERFCSWPSWISARTRSHSRKGPERPVVPPDHGCDGETVSPSPQSDSQTRRVFFLLSGYATGDGSRWPQTIRGAAALRQDRPGDPRQLVGERGCQNIVMQALGCSCEPRSKAVFCPIGRSEQNDASALHEQRAQIAIATLCNAAEDRPIPCGHLLRHEAEPGGKIAPLGKGSPIANCRYHCAGDNRSDARNGHQLPTGLTVAGQKFDLLCHVFDTLIETAPVAAEVLDNPDHSRR